MFTFRHTAAATAATACLTVLLTATPTAASDANSAALVCGTTVTADTRLRTDLLDCQGSALIVGAPDITIDLAGHTLSGMGTGPGIDNNGAHDNVTIKRGTIRGFAQGIDVIDAARTRIRDVTLRDNALGITMGRTRHAVIERVNAKDNAFAGIEAFQTEGLTVRHSTISGSGHGGIIDRGSYNSRHEYNILSRNAFFGLLLDTTTDAVAVGNVVRSSEGDGIQLGFWTRTARLERNRVIANGANGILIDEPGNVLTGNLATKNGAVGIRAVPGTVDGGRNRAFGNLGGDCVVLACR